MIKKVVYQQGLERFANELKQFGFSVFPLGTEDTYDALIFCENENTGFISDFKGTRQSIFLLNIYSLNPKQAAAILKARLYSPVFSHHLSAHSTCS